MFVGETWKLDWVRENFPFLPKFPNLVTFCETPVLKTVFMDQCMKCFSCGFIDKHARNSVRCSHDKIPWSRGGKVPHAWLAYPCAAYSYWSCFECNRTLSPFCWRGYAHWSQIPSSRQHSSFLGCPGNKLFVNFLVQEYHSLGHIFLLLCSLYVNSW